jgi:hypothetical protein
LANELDREHVREERTMRDKRKTIKNTTDTMREQINNELNDWYQKLTYQDFQEIYGQDNITNDVKGLWYKMSIDDKIYIYDGLH